MGARVLKELISSLKICNSDAAFRLKICNRDAIFRLKICKALDKALRFCDTTPEREC